MGARARSRFCSFLVALFAALPAVAQESGTDRADPGEIERRIQQIPTPPPAEQPPEVAPPAAVQPEVRATPELSFVLAGVVFDGGTIFTPGQLAPVYADFLARRVGRAELEEIAARITGLYMEAGYFLSRAVVPPQQVEGGILRVRLIEGRIARVRFRGAESRLDFLAGFEAAMTGERPARLATIERSLLLINSRPGFRVRGARLTPPDRDGAYELIVQVDYDPAQAFVSLDNRGTPEVGRLQSFVAADANALAGLGERARVVLATVPDEPRELLYGQLSYEQPLGYDGTVLEGSLTGSRIDAGADLAAQDTEAASLKVALAGRHPVILSRRESLSLRGSLEWVESEEERFGETTLDDSLRVARIEADYSVRDPWRGTNLVSLEVSQGLGVLGASEVGDSNLSRDDGDPTFTSFRVDAARRQEIWGPVTLRLASQAQVALDPLLSREEFRVGGARFGRAYDFGEVSGEDGVAGSVELRYGQRFGDDLVSSYQFYGFYDVGVTWDRNTAGEDGQQAIRSAGGGLRLEFLRAVDASLEVAKPLSRRVESTGDRDVRLFVSIGARF